MADYKPPERAAQRIGEICRRMVVEPDFMPESGAFARIIREEYAETEAALNEALDALSYICGQRSVCMGYEGWIERVAEPLLAKHGRGDG